MAFRMFYEQDCDVSKLDGKKVAIIGYGSQGHAHALNLKDSGVNVRVALREGSASKAKAESQGLEVVSNAEAAAWADIVLFLRDGRVVAEMDRPDPDRVLDALRDLAAEDDERDADPGGPAGPGPRGRGRR